VLFPFFGRENDEAALDLAMGMSSARRGMELVFWKMEIEPALVCLFAYSPRMARDSTRTITSWRRTTNF
jgi:hypothetical protein